MGEQLKNITLKQINAQNKVKQRVEAAILIDELFIKLEERLQYHIRPLF